MVFESKKRRIVIDRSKNESRFFVDFSRTTVIRAGSERAGACDDFDMTELAMKTVLTFFIDQNKALFDSKAWNMADIS